MDTKSHFCCGLERKTGLEPATYSEAVALPNELLPLIKKLWERKDSNLRRLRQQIYSLPHLATLELSQQKKEPVDGFEPPTG